MSGSLPTVAPKSFLSGVIQSQTNLGEGGYGTVFLGHWYGRKVAIKRFHPHKMGLEEKTGKQSRGFQSFITEYDTLHALSHPSIVQVFGWIRPNAERGSQGLVMEYLPMTLKERYGAEPPLDVRQHVHVMLSASSGLEYLHSNRVMHRDLTTKNIMMTAGAGSGPEDGQCKITDVGQARALGDASRDEQTMTEAPGAQKYMAPETHSDTQEGLATYGPKADIYSLGVSMMAMIIKREPPNIYILAKQPGREGDVKDIPRDHPLRPLIIQCIAIPHGERSSARELCSELAKVIEHFPTPPDAAAVIAKLKAENASLQRQLDQTVGELTQAAGERYILRTRNTLHKERALVIGEAYNRGPSLGDAVQPSHRDRQRSTSYETQTLGRATAKFLQWTDTKDREESATGNVEMSRFNRYPEDFVKSRRKYSMFSSSSAETETPVQASRITVKPMFAYNSRDEDELSSAERNIPELSSEGFSLGDAVQPSHRDRQRSTSYETQTLGRATAKFLQRTDTKDREESATGKEEMSLLGKYFQKVPSDLFGGGPVRFRSESGHRKPCPKPKSTSSGRPGEDELSFRERNIPELSSEDSDDLY